MFTEYLRTHDLSALLGAPGSYRPFPKAEDRAAWEGLAPDVRQAILAWGGEAKQGYPPVTATQFLAFVRTGDRQIFERPYFGRRKLLIGAALAECVLGDGTHMDAVIDGLWTICEESTWVISAHNDARHPMSPAPGDRVLPDVEDPYIDLFAAQTSATLAFVLYFLEDRLNAVSTRIARRVRHEIERRILRPFRIHDDFWWMGMIRKDMNNWTPWILSNLLYTILLLERDGVLRCEMTARAMRMLDSYLAVMPEDGGCDEGAGYFNMAGASLLDCLEAIYEATDGRVSFYHEPHIRAIFSFPLKAHIDGAYYLNFADCDARPTLDGEPLVRCGLRTGIEPLCALGAAIRRRRGRLPQIADTPQMNRVLYTLFDPIPDLPQPEAPAFMQMPDLQVFAWRRGGLYAAIKGGSNNESHNHNDVGAFILYAGGEPQVVDMGNMVYTAKTFGPERYTLLNTRSMNHNVPLIGGVEQCEGAEHIAKDVSADECGARMDIAAAYPGEAGVTSAVRSLQITENGASLKDSISLAQARDVQWVFILRDKPALAPGKVRFGRMAMRHDPQLVQAVREMPVTDARMMKSYPGSLWRLTLSAPAACAHSAEFSFTLTDKEASI
ncbi:MAG: heparinase II/III family protein [Clostridia bacterium]|nr:heparinase II/III family protein [Clostridia bacterium]